MIVQKFDYSKELDSKIYCFGKLVINKVAITIDACTIAGSKDGISEKPNEDCFSVIKINNSLITAVFDGCSSQKPIAFLKDQTGARFASHFLKKTLEETDESELPNKLIRFLNNQLLSRTAVLKGTTLNDVHTLPASTATIVQVDLKEKKLRISHVGDTFCILKFTDNHTEFVTIDRNRQYDNEIFNLIKKIASEKSITPKEARKEELVKKAILDMFQDSYNKLNGTGQGVLNGDPNVEKYIQDISFPLTSIKSILIGSDGLIPPDWDEQNEKDREKIFKVIKTEGLKKLIRIKQDIENSDSDWQLVRYKHSDDATGVYITFDS